MDLEFASKRDKWISFVIWVSVLAIGMAAVDLVAASRWLLLGSLVAAACGMLWVFYGTRYTVTGDELVVRSGPLRWKVRLSSITSVVPSNDPIASPAGSLDRLEIRYDNGKKRILVSPLDKEAFQAALVARRSTTTDTKSENEVTPS